MAESCPIHVQLRPAVQSRLHLLATMNKFSYEVEQLLDNCIPIQLKMTCLFIEK